MTRFIHYEGSRTNEHNSVSFICHVDVKVFCGICFASLCTQLTTGLDLSHTVQVAYWGGMLVCRQVSLQDIMQLQSPKQNREDKGLSNG